MNWRYYFKYLLPVFIKGVRRGWNHFNIGWMLPVILRAASAGRVQEWSHPNFPANTGAGGEDREGHPGLSSVEIEHR